MSRINNTNSNSISNSSINSKRYIINNYEQELSATQVTDEEFATLRRTYIIIHRLYKDGVADGRWEINAINSFENGVKSKYIFIKEGEDAAISAIHQLHDDAFQPGEWKVIWELMTLGAGLPLVIEARLNEDFEWKIYVRYGRPRRPKSTYRKCSVCGRRGEVGTCYRGGPFIFEIETGTNNTQYIYGGYGSKSLDGFIFNLTPEQARVWGKRKICDSCIIPELDKLGPLQWHWYFGPEAKGVDLASNLVRKEDSELN